MAKRKTPTRSRGAGRRKRSRKAQIQFVADRLLGVEPDYPFKHAIDAILKEIYCDAFRHALDHKSPLVTYFK